MLDVAGDLCGFAKLPTNAIVLYSRNQTGDIQRMYILTDAEIQLAVSGRR